MTSTIDNMLVDVAVSFDMPDKYDGKVVDEIVRVIEGELDRHGFVAPDAIERWDSTYELDAALALFNGELYDDDGVYCNEQTMRETLEESVGYMDAIDAAWYARNH